jgi:hypothetical protein
MRGFEFAAVRRAGRESGTPLTDGQPDFFSRDEIKAIDRLQRLTEFSPLAVRRVYVAAGKNESMAASLLFAMPDAADTHGRGGS